MRLLEFMYRFKQRLQDNAPYDTGNLRNRGIHNPHTITPNKVGIKIGGEEVAPYAPILEYADTIKYYTKDGVKSYPNKHKGWGKRTLDEFVKELANELGGSVK